MANEYIDKIQIEGVDYSLKDAGASRSDHTHPSYENQNAFSNITVGSTTLTADNTTDTFTLVAGSNVTLTPDAANDKITISATDTNTHNSHAVISGLKADGSTQIKGSASSGDITLGDSGATAGNYGDSSNQTPGYGSTFKVPYIQVNAKGIVTGVSQHTVTIPASDNTHNSHKVITGLKADGTTTIQSASASSGDITVGDSGVTAGEYGPTADATATFSGTISVPDIKVNAKGIVTSAATRTITLPTPSGTYLPLSGGVMTGTITTKEDALAIKFRTNTSYVTGIAYETAGNEAMVVGTKNAVTSFMVVNGMAIESPTNSQWQSVTPGLQVKNNCVSIGKLISNNTTPTYKLDVSGTTNSKDYKVDGACDIKYNSASGCLEIIC